MKHYTQKIVKYYVTSSFKCSYQLPFTFIGTSPTILMSSVVTSNINSLTKALSATEVYHPKSLQLTVQKDYDQDVLFLKTSSMRPEEYWHMIARNHFHLTGNCLFSKSFCYHVGISRDFHKG